jgi:hypothetical protein
MVSLETFARAPAIDVLCGESDAAKAEMIRQPASKQILKGRLIGSPFHEASNITVRGGVKKRHNRSP